MQECAMKSSSDRRGRSGFTLIEVLLVLVILVIIASLAVMAYGPIQRRAKVNAAKVQVELLATALDSYQLSVGVYPSATAGLQALRRPPSDLPSPDKWDGPYLSKDIPLDPWGKAYQYRYPGVHNPDRFDVWTVSPDSQEIGNWTEQTR
jgi:general secretion pathway protein G